MAELVRAELLDAEAAAEAKRGSTSGGPHSASNGLGGGDYSDVIRELVGKAEQQAVEIGRLRALTAGSEGKADRLRAELFESRARVGELEAREASRRRWFRRG